MHFIFKQIKVSLARILARFYYWICDPQVESELGDPRDYEYFQAERRRKMELYLAKYLGPRL